MLQRLAKPAAGRTWQARFHAAAARRTIVWTVLAACSHASLAAGPVPQTWSLTGAMNVPRMFHSASLLHSGKLLAAGGSGESSELLRSAELYDPSSGTWSPTNSMNSGRQSHTSTTLADGRVLVTGGCDFLCINVLSSSEVYDPQSHQWTVNGNLVTARVGHTATLLGNGKVLVAGGGVAASELYDPATGLWTATGSMNVARTGSTATLLANGQVLVAGGCGTPSTPCAGELYNPGTGIWTSTPPMTTCQSYGAAALLGSGDVLVAGGFCGLGYESTAELYHPSSNTWITTTNMSAAMAYNFTIPLPDGSVLGSGDGTAANLYIPASRIWKVTGAMIDFRYGGTATRLQDGTVLAAGGSGCNIDFVCSSAEIYTPGPSPLLALSPNSLSFPPQLMGSTSAPQTVTVTNQGSLPLQIGSVSVSGSGFMVFGSCSGATVNPGTSCAVNVVAAPSTAGPVSASVTIPDNAPNNPHSFGASGAGYQNGPHRWQPAGNLRTARTAHTATLLSDQQVLVAGGFPDNLLFQPISSAELYDPASNTWLATADMQVARGGHTATLLPDGKVLAAGGGDASAEIFDPALGVWTLSGSMSTPRAEHTATLLRNGKVLVTGGCGGGACTSAELYDPSTGTWQLTGSMHAARYLHTATLLDSGKVLVCGGLGAFNDLSSAELYDPSSGTWSATGALIAARDGHTATLLANGQVLVAGGEQQSFESIALLSEAEIYDPASGAWKVTGSMSTPRWGHTAIQVRNGAILVAGGENTPPSEGGIGSSTATAELYNLQTGVWTLTGSMIAARQNHTATKLTNGQILVVGGGNQAAITVVSGAEQYTP